MFLYVELWNAKECWLDLSKEERKEFLEKATSSIQKLVDEDVEVILAFNHPEVPDRVGYNFITVWKTKLLETVLNLQKAVADSEWNDYFDQVNAGGEVIGFENLINQLINVEDVRSKRAD